MSILPPVPMPTTWWRHRAGAVVAVAVVAVLGALAPGATADAAPAAATDFQIRYWIVDEGGGTRIMLDRDRRQFVNAARCECNQLVKAQVTLTATGQVVDPDRVSVFAGGSCAQGQLGNTDFNRPCVLLDEQLPIAFTDRPTYTFPMIWLSSGIKEGGSQSLGSAEPEASCNSGQGSQTGIWICVETNGTNDCQPEEFIIQGADGLDAMQSPADAIGGGGSSSGIVYDYEPPLALPTGFRVAGGDGAVVISWDAMSMGEGGYRILCADANGNPVPGHGVAGPTAGEENDAQIYFTPRNLCPDGPFDQTPEGEVDNPMGPSDGGTGTGGGGTGGDGRGSTTGLGAEAWDDSSYAGPVAGGAHPTGTAGTTGASTDGGSSGSGTGSGTGAGSSSGAGAGSSSGTGAGSGGSASAGIESLDWAYVCSPHIVGTDTSGRVEGLENGVAYQFLVVAYDVAGNPANASGIVEGSPQETTDLWEQCEAQGGVCGQGGFCSCRTGGAPPSVPEVFMAFGVLGLLRRRRDGRAQGRAS